MRRKKGNKPLRSETGIRLMQYPHIIVRVVELGGSPFLYLGRQINHKPKYTVIIENGRKFTWESLGNTPKERKRKARALGEKEIERIAEAEKAPPPKSSTGGLLTLGQLADRYERDGFAGRTDGYRRDALASIRRIASVLGDKALSDLLPSDLEKYYAK